MTSTIPTVDAEIVDDNAGKKATPVNSSVAAAGTVFNRHTTVASPFFWLFVGGIAVVCYYEWLRYNENKKK